MNGNEQEEKIEYLLPVEIGIECLPWHVKYSMGLSRVR